MNFAARDCGFAVLSGAVRPTTGFAPAGLKALFGFSKVRSSRDCFGLPFTAPSTFLDFEAVRSWKRCARSFERSARRTSFFVTLSRSE